MKNVGNIIDSLNKQADEFSFQFNEECSQDNFYHTPLVVNECDKPLDNELKLLVYPYSI